jgi:hypothetical protein
LALALAEKLSEIGNYQQQHYQRRRYRQEHASAPKTTVAAVACAGSIAPILLGLTLHCRRRRVLDLEPTVAERKRSLAGNRRHASAAGTKINSKAAL